MKSKIINGIKIYHSSDKYELINYSFSKKKILIAINAEKILGAQNLKDIINRNVGYPDGIGAVWALKKTGAQNVIKIPGCELWLDIINKYYQNKTFYLIGGTADVIENTVFKLRLNFPGINILNYRDGYFNSQNDINILKQNLKLNRPDIVFVAMGSPKQELLMEELYDINPALYQGLGGSFDVYSGNTKRAPKWLISKNLEWAYRMITQPIKIRRYFKLLRFYYQLLTNKIC